MNNFRRNKEDLADLPRTLMSIWMPSSCQWLRVEAQFMHRTLQMLTSWTTQTKPAAPESWWAQAHTWASQEWRKTCITPILTRVSTLVVTSALTITRVKAQLLKPFSKRIPKIKITILWLERRDGPHLKRRAITITICTWAPIRRTRTRNECQDSQL